MCWHNGLKDLLLDATLALSTMCIRTQKRGVLTHDTVLGDALGDDARGQSPLPSSAANDAARSLQRIVDEWDWALSVYVRKCIRSKLTSWNGWSALFTRATSKLLRVVYTSGVGTLSPASELLPYWPRPMACYCPTSHSASSCVCLWCYGAKKTRHPSMQNETFAFLDSKSRKLLKPLKGWI